MSRAHNRDFCMHLAASSPIKKPAPTNHCWDRRYIPAVPPGLAHRRPLCAYVHMLALVNEVPAPSRILAQRLSVRPRKTIHHCHPAVFPPSTALCKRLNSEYLLFLIGFAYYTVFPTSCQCFIMLNCTDTMGYSRTTNRSYACLYFSALSNPFSSEFLVMHILGMPASIHVSLIIRLYPPWPHAQARRNPQSAIRRSAWGARPP